MRKFSFYILIGMIGLTLAWLSGQVGWWWMTAMVGMLIGILIRPAWLALVTSLAVGGLAWGLPLAVLAFNAPVGRISVAVEAVIGLTATSGIIIILLTVMLGCVLSIVGTWVGIAASRPSVIS